MQSIVSIYTYAHMHIADAETVHLQSDWVTRKQEMLSLHNQENAQLSPDPLFLLAGVYT